MIEVESLAVAYQDVVRNASCATIADAPIAKGGSAAGFGAHELLEAVLATCINMAVRMHAAQKGMALDGVVTRVALSWSDADTTHFDYALTFSGDLSDAERVELEGVAKHCPVRQTLPKHLVFARVA